MWPFVILLLVLCGAGFWFAGIVGAVFMLLVCGAFFAVGAFILWCAHGFNQAVADDVEQRLRDKNRW